MESGLLATSFEMVPDQESDQMLETSSIGKPQGYDLA